VWVTGKHWRHITYLNQQSWRQLLTPSPLGGGNNGRILINTDSIPNSSRHQFYGGTIGDVSLNYDL
jgi:hypothetical protein